MVPYGYPKDYSVGRFNRAEVKSITWAIGNNGSLVPLAQIWQSINIPNNIATGTDLYQRDGRVITMKSLLLRLRINTTDTYAYSYGGGGGTFNGFNYQRHPQVVRLIVFFDRYNNGTSPGAADVFQTTSDIVGGGIALQAIDCMMNLNNRKRFKIIMDKSYRLGTTGWSAGTGSGVATDYMSTSDSCEIIVNKFIKLKGLETIYGGNTNAVGSINQGALFVWCVSSQAGPAQYGNAASAVGFAAGITGNIRLRYTG